MPGQASISAGSGKPAVPAEQANNGRLDPGAAYLPPFIRARLAAAPVAGEGVHKFLFVAARLLHAWRTEAEIRTALCSYADGCGRYVPAREIDDAINDSRPCSWRPGPPGEPRTPTPPRPRVAAWPPVNQHKLQGICRTGAGLYDLWDCSPIRIEDDTAAVEQLVDLLFPGNPWLCAGFNQSDFATRLREEWRGELTTRALIVPSPMVAKTGMTQHGAVSEHAQAAVGPRQFLVVECDFAQRNRNDTADTALAPLVRELGGAGITEHDMCAAVLLHLAGFAPLAAAVHSGKKSVHGWFPCAGRPEEQLHRFMRYAVSLGGDAATWRKGQFVRLPGGLRDGKIRQRIFYFIPAAL